MGNCCRIFINANINEVKTLLANTNSVMKFSDNPIVPAKESYFGNVRKDLINYVEVNLINSINEVCNLIRPLSKDILIVQDLDGYGIDTYFSN